MSSSHCDMFTDIDECSSDNGGCSQICTNEGGSYKCSCEIGYQLIDDNHGCDGIPIENLSNLPYSTNFLL